MNASVGRVVRYAVAQHLNVDTSQIRLRDRMDRDLALTPLDVALIALQIEEIEGVEFPRSLLAGTRTIRDLAELLYNLLSSSDCRRSAAPRLAPASRTAADGLRSPAPRSPAP